MTRVHGDYPHLNKPPRVRFPSGTRVQNLKIDVQGSELKVLKGAKRLLRENKGRCKLRLEMDENLLNRAGTGGSEIVAFMLSLGYRVVAKGADYDFE